MPENKKPCEQSASLQEATLLQIIGKQTIQIEIFRSQVVSLQQQLALIQSENKKE